MNNANDICRKLQSARERTAAPSAAILRANASLDFDTVLGEAVESARALNDAR